MPPERLKEVLEEAGLGHFAGELDSIDQWAQRLSGGEQQRLWIARALLAKPAILLLDASLDEAGQSTLYQRLRSLPCHPTIVSVGHRASLPQFRDRVLNLGPAARASE